MAITRSTAAKRIAAQVNAQTEEMAMAVYSGLRLRVMGDRKAGTRTPSSIADCMVLAGEALEQRIGEARFDSLMAEIDAHVFG